MRRVAGNILLLMISTIVSLFAAEFITRSVSPQNLSGTWKQVSKTGGYWVNKDSGESLQQFENRTVRYHFGKHHLRVGSTRLDAPHKVLVVGDSFTFGSLLNWEHTYVGRLQQAADHAFGSNKIEFLNAAVIGWGTADYVAFYEDYGDELGARTILVFLNTDDIGRGVGSGIYAISGASYSLQRQPPTRLPGSQLKSFANAFPFYEYLIEHSHLLQLMRSVVTLGISRGAAPPELSRQWENAIVIPRSIADDISSDSSTRLAKALFQRLFR